MPVDTLLIESPDLGNLARRYTGIGPVIEKELLGTTKRAAFALERVAKQHAPKGATGNLASSIAGDAKPIAGGVRGVVEVAAGYGEVVEKGRRAGAAPPPKGALLPWMRFAKIPPEAEDRLRWSISVKGIAARPFLSRAFTELRPRIVEDFKGVPKRVIAAITAKGAGGAP